MSAGVQPKWYHNFCLKSQNQSNQDKHTDAQDQQQVESDEACSSGKIIPVAWIKAVNTGQVVHVLRQTKWKPKTDQAVVNDVVQSVVINQYQWTIWYRPNGAHRFHYVFGTPNSDDRKTYLYVYADGAKLKLRNGDIPDITIVAEEDDRVFEQTTLQRTRVGALKNVKASIQGKASFVGVNTGWRKNVILVPLRNGAAAWDIILPPEELSEQKVTEVKCEPAQEETQEECSKEKEPPEQE